MKYWYTKEINYNFEETIELIKESMLQENFWLLTHFNLQDIFKNKLGKNIDKYIVLGFCNPTLAFEAISEEMEMWLLLPCNIIVFEKKQKIYISSILINSWINFTGNSKLLDLSKQVEIKLKRAINNI